MIRLIRDVLDNELVDRRQTRMGKADGIVVEFAGGGPPRIRWIEVGFATRLRRIHPALARWFGRWSKPYRIAWPLVRDLGVDLDVDIDARETPLLRFEERLRRLLAKAPFS